ncbi:hypothetical protein [Paenibacillus sp. PDC88]|uniref:hypothetical protein n=1 Tax=Paenibacillus sp. PDC88 TaxID=1884375 RepID=UPI000B8333E6|nr:hypothetical protein [Paenibacillus sp. PDC88]
MRYKRLSGEHRIVGSVTVDQDLTYPITADLDGTDYIHHIVQWGEDKVPRTAGAIHISKDFSTIWIKSDDFDTKYSIMDGYAFGPTEAWEKFKSTMPSDQN